jgi:hypothetical protein
VVVTGEAIVRVRGRFTPTERFCDTGDPADLGRVTVDRIPTTEVNRITVSAGKPIREGMLRNIGEKPGQNYWVRYFVETADRTLTFRVPYRDCRNVNGRLGEALGRRFIRDFNYTPDLPQRPRRRPASGRPPLRSSALGWLVKLLAVGIAVGVCWVDIQLTLTGTWRPAPMLPGLLRPICYVPAVLLLYLGFRLSLRTFAPGEHADERNVVLYLRSFADDARTSLQPTSLLARLHGILPNWTDLQKASSWLGMMNPARVIGLFFNLGAGFAEEDYARAVAGVGPLVAIGRPNALLGAPGADRMYVRDTEWQAVVLDYLGRSCAVILQPSASDGIQWEIEQTMAHVPPHKVLFSMVNFYRRPDDYEPFREWLWLTTGVRLPALVPHWSQPCFIDFETDYSPKTQLLCYRSPFLWPIKGNAVDAHQTFARFLAGLEGGQRPAPKAPRNQTLEEVGSVILFLYSPLALWLAAVLGLWPFG